MANEQRELRQREATLVAELTRVRARLQEAGFDAQRSSNEAAAAERRHAQDIAAERAETRAAHAEADELRHRVKNTLAVVQAIANATLRPDTPFEQARAAFNARLEALAHVHDILFESGWTSANLTSIIEGILAPYIETKRNRVRTRGPDINLNPKPALALALAFHELATNAAKYGALSNDDGYVEIAWILAPVAKGEELRLRWHERNGPPVAPPSHKGFGSRLVERNLADEFNGTVRLEFQPDGLACTICAPAQEMR